MYLLSPPIRQLFRIGIEQKRTEVSPLTILPDFNQAPIFRAGFLPQAVFCFVFFKKFHDSISTSPLNEV